MHVAINYFVVLNTNKIGFYFCDLFFLTIRSDGQKGDSSKISSLSVCVLFVCRSEPSSAEKAHEDSMLQQEIKAMTERERSESDIIFMCTCSTSLLHSPSGALQ